MPKRMIVQRVGAALAFAAFCSCAGLKPAFDSAVGDANKMFGNIVQASASDPASKPDAYDLGRFNESEREIDARIARLANVEPRQLEGSKILDVPFDAASGDLCLLMLDKAMTRLAAGDAETATVLMERARPVWIDRYIDTYPKYLGGLKGLAIGDQEAPFHGADYEHLMLTAMLSLCDYLSVRKSYYAWANDFSRMQDSMLSTGYGADVNPKHDPRRKHQRLAIGKYVVGMIDEQELRWDSALRSYSDADTFQPHVGVIEAAVRRNDSGHRDPPGFGAVHVFYLGGRGPHLRETKSEPKSESVVALANLGLLLLKKDGLKLVQAPVPVPEIVIEQASVAPLSIRVDGNGATTKTETLLNINDIAKNQLEADSAMVMARAVIRRTLVAVVSSQVGNLVGGYGDLAAFGLNHTMAAFEHADTRCWSTLPAQFQAARIALSEGDHALDLGAGMIAQVHVKSGCASVVVVVRPNTSVPGTVIVDRMSRGQAAEPVVASK